MYLCIYNVYLALSILLFLPCVLFLPSYVNLSERNTCIVYVTQIVFQDPLFNVTKNKDDCPANPCLVMAFVAGKHE